MTEKIPLDLDGSTKCGLEGVGGRPPDCWNNPWRYPDNWRLDLCRQCPENPSISKVAELPLPYGYVLTKQERQRQK